MSKIAKFWGEVRRRGPITAVRMALRWLWIQHHARDPEIVRTVQTHNQFFFDGLNVAREAVEKRYAVAAAKADVIPGPLDSIHRLAFAALAESGFTPQTILELGTSHADTTIILAELFPDAIIYTVELPDDDPIYDTTHPSHDRRNARAARLDAYTNIRQLRINTLWLMSQDLPGFDLIWLDAGHHFPEVAWDHSFCIQKLNPGGWLFTDDVMRDDSKVARREPSHRDVWNVLSYLDARLPGDFKFLLKRESAQQWAINPKYVGFYHDD